jgi:hypothetical protein
VAKIDKLESLQAQGKGRQSDTHVWDDGHRRDLHAELDRATTRSSRGAGGGRPGAVGDLATAGSLDANHPPASPLGNWTLTFSSEGRKLASGGDDGSVIL